MGRILRRIILVLAAALSASALPPEDQGCLSCHGKAGFASKGKDLFVDQAVYEKSVHAKQTCLGCHSDLEDKKHPGKPVDKVSCATCHADASKTYEKSIHAQLRRSGTNHSASCTDCHGSHEAVGALDPASPVNRANLNKTCAKCHDDIVADYKESVHGQAMAKGIKEVPSCTTCHAEHEIHSLKGTVTKKAEEVCMQCHASERLNTKFNLPKDRVTSFQESYHGLAGKLGDVRAANCASCHGFHRILNSSDPRSSVHASNLVQTCQKCHPGTSANFAQGKIHPDPNGPKDIGAKIDHWVRQGYLWLIYLTVGGMLAHNLLGLWRKARKALRDPDRTVIRMNLTARLQHAGLALSFIYLVLTGFALKYPDSILGTVFGANETVRRVGHRIAAVIMMVVAVIHLIYAIFTPHGRQFVKDMLPSYQDLKDALLQLRYFVRPRYGRPHFGRFGYAEKAEYWAVVWGTMVMGATGLLIWFKEFVTHYVPRWVVDVSITIHLYEAILATLAIIVWHFYFIFFDPDVYPINWAWMDGRVSKEHYEEEHGLDKSYEEAGIHIQPNPDDIEDQKHHY